MRFFCVVLICSQCLADSPDLAAAFARKLQEFDAGSGATPPSPPCPWGNRDDFCRHRMDGACDDGGDGASYASCPYGTDVTDCGVREECGERDADYCHFVNDGSCDDGGPGAEFYSCYYGTDPDCGERPPAPPPAPSPAPAVPQEHLCDHHDAMLGVSWAFSIFWSLLLALWCYVLARTCMPARRPAAEPGAPVDAAPPADVADGAPVSEGGGAPPPPPPGCKCRFLQWVLIIVPFFHLGQALFDLYTYNTCECMRCSFVSIEAIWTYIGLSYTFSLGRLTSLLLCLYIIATGAGTVRPRLLARNWLLLVLLFGGFLAASALGLPVTVILHGVDATGAFVAQMVMYFLLLITILLDASVNLRVLKAQLLMIRAQGIAPTTCPAWHKFKLFRNLRRYIVLYFLTHTLIIIAMMAEGNLPLWSQAAMLVVWEVAQLGITFLIGWLFTKGSGSLGTHNPYLDRETHLPDSQITTFVHPTEVNLGLDDLSLVEEDMGSQPLLQTWQPSTAVPAPPTAPAVISIVLAGPSRRRKRNRTAPRPHPAPTPPVPLSPDSGSPPTSDGARSGTEMSSVRSGRGPPFNV